MPIKSCTLPNGKSGFKFGDSGKCYSDKKDAIRQGIAEMGPEKFKQEVQKSKAALSTQILIDIKNILQGNKETKKSFAELVMEGLNLNNPKK